MTTAAMNGWVSERTRTEETRIVINPVSALVPPPPDEDELDPCGGMSGNSEKGEVLLNKSLIPKTHPGHSGQHFPLY